uniref:DNA repair-scaffolding protein isoform X3 n=1 Tax=Jaculus jaculus TaxID=51337 RepID=UPI001E1B32A1|nr:DNA repair-scaffolding protein isoform X3 [Jaculus jaculus]
MPILFRREATTVEKSKSPDSGLILAQVWRRISGYFWDFETLSKSSNEIANITWSSSESESSDEDKAVFKSQRDNGHSSKIHRFCSRNTLCPEDEVTEDEVQSIDWEVDSNRKDADDCNESEDGEGAMAISDCASCASGHSLTSEDGLPELSKSTATEIVEYSSDSDKDEDSENVPFIDSESPHKCHVNCDLDTRQVTDKIIYSRAKSTELILHASHKQTVKFPRTPESLAKKKKLLRGGLAERLNSLQNRERSAISMWRHQCDSYQKTLSGRKHSVLTVKILELHEECTMQVAMCEQLLGPPATSPSLGVTVRPGVGLKVLFMRETAGYLRVQPQDIVHIFPPWQKLIIPSGSCPVILNTYFCQKVVAKETAHEVYCRDISLPRRNITLAQTFRIKDLTVNSPENQIVCSGLPSMGTGWTHKYEEATQYPEVDAPLRDSLLDIVESQRAAPWSGVGVRVVVQRVYSLLGKDGTRAQQGHIMVHKNVPETRLCLLVQDVYGMFGEVHLEETIWKDRALEGKSCSIAGMKVLQKATRERAPGLFSLIDTILPPERLLKVSSHSQSSEEVKMYLPPPNFCYSFLAQGQIDIIEGDPTSKLYQPPVVHCLREIFQTNERGSRCSFYASVIYQRPQVKNLLVLEQKEFWLLVTDITLQMRDESNPHLPKTLPVRVTPSCVLGPEVLEALVMTAPHSILFRDALQDQAGHIICVERTVLLPILRASSGFVPCELTDPIMLDELDSFTPVNSICSVQGVVVDVDESTAFSWPVCDQCGDRRLEQRPEDRGAFFCGYCSRLVTTPVQKRHLQVFLECPSKPQSTVKVKLLQNSISSLLRFATSEDGSYEVKRVLGKEVGPLPCFVQFISTHPASCTGLEEIELLSAGRACLAGQPPRDP